MNNRLKVGALLRNQEEYLESRTSGKSNNASQGVPIVATGRGPERVYYTDRKYPVGHPPSLGLSVLGNLRAPYSSPTKNRITSEERQTEVHEIEEKPKSSHVSISPISLTQGPTSEDVNSINIDSDNSDDGMNASIHAGNQRQSSPAAPSINPSRIESPSHSLRHQLVLSPQKSLSNKSNSGDILPLSFNYLLVSKDYVITSNLTVSLRANVSRNDDGTRRGGSLLFSVQGLRYRDGVPISLSFNASIDLSHVIALTHISAFVLILIIRNDQVSSELQSFLRSIATPDAAIPPEDSQDITLAFVAERLLDPSSSSSTSSAKGIPEVDGSVQRRRNVSPYMRFLERWYQDIFASDSDVHLGNKFRNTVKMQDGDVPGSILPQDGVSFVITTTYLKRMVQPAYNIESSVGDNYYYSKVSHTNRGGRLSTRVAVDNIINALTRFRQGELKATLLPNAPADHPKPSTHATTQAHSPSQPHFVVHSLSRRQNLSGFPTLVTYGSASKSDSLPALPTRSSSSVPLKASLMPSLAMQAVRELRQAESRANPFSSSTSSHSRAANSSTPPLTSSPFASPMKRKTALSLDEEEEAASAPSSLSTLSSLSARLPILSSASNASSNSTTLASISAALSSYSPSKLKPERKNAREELEIPIDRLMNLGYIPSTVFLEDTTATSTATSALNVAKANSGRITGPESTNSALFTYPAVEELVVYTEEDFGSSVKEEKRPSKSTSSHSAWSLGGTNGKGATDNADSIHNADGNATAHMTYTIDGDTDDGDEDAVEIIDPSELNDTKAEYAFPTNDTPRFPASSPVSAGSLDGQDFSQEKSLPGGNGAPTRRRIRVRKVAPDATDLQRLSPGEYLNDTVIDWWIMLLCRLGQLQATLPNQIVTLLHEIKTPTTVASDSFDTPSKFALETETLDQSFARVAQTFSSSPHDSFTQYCELNSFLFQTMSEAGNRYARSVKPRVGTRRRSATGNINVNSWSEDVWQAAYASVRRWGVPGQIFRATSAILPVNYGLHWSLSIAANLSVLDDWFRRTDTALRKFYAEWKDLDVGSVEDSLSTSLTGSETAEHLEMDDVEDTADTSVQMKSAVDDARKKGSEVQSLLSPKDDANGIVQSLPEALSRASAPSTPMISDEAIIESESLGTPDSVTASTRAAFSATSTPALTQPTQPPRVYTKEEKTQHRIDMLMEMRKVIPPLPSGDELAPCILFFDTLQLHSTALVCAVFRQYLYREWCDKRNAGEPLGGRVDSLRDLAEIGFGLQDILPTITPSVPSQPNEVDCGVYLLCFVDIWMSLTRPNSQFHRITADVAKRSASTRKRRASSMLLLSDTDSMKMSSTSEQESSSSSTSNVGNLASREHWICNPQDVLMYRILMYKVAKSCQLGFDNLRKLSHSPFDTSLQILQTLCWQYRTAKTKDISLGKCI